MTADTGPPSLIVLDLSATFDTDNNILLCCHTTMALSNSVYWLSYYLCERTEHILACGVPQGSLLGPTLFTLYPLGSAISTIIPLLCQQHTALLKDWSHSKHSALTSCQSHHLPWGDKVEEACLPAAKQPSS